MIFKIVLKEDKCNKNLEVMTTCCFTVGAPPPSVWTFLGQYFLKAISPIKNNHNYLNVNV